MLNAEEILYLLKSCPQGCLKPDHKLFETSNSHLIPFYRKLGAISNKEDETLNDSRNSTSGEIFCHVLGCKQIFDNVASYQSHYNVMHRFICIECKKSLPTEHLLDLHISEQHDSYFKARVERGQRLFKCYLEECKETFANPMERKEHCIKEHKFPSNFRFDQTTQKNEKSAQNAIKVVDKSQDSTISKQRELKVISFGHQKEKTFRPRNGPKQNRESGKTLENMDTLKQALESM
ncbi:zinc finger protein 511 lethal (2) k10201 [Cochliomyia hominivorax]